MSIEQATTKESLIDYYHSNYPWEYYQKYPEFAMNKICMTPESFESNLSQVPESQRKSYQDFHYKMNIDKQSLQKLPPMELRNRDVITEWLKNSHLTYDDIMFVGW